MHCFWRFGKFEYARLIKSTPFLIVIDYLIIFTQHVAWHCSSSSNGRKSPPKEICCYQEQKLNSWQSCSQSIGICLKGFPLSFTYKYFPHTWGPIIAINMKSSNTRCHFVYMCLYFNLHACQINFNHLCHQIKMMPTPFLNKSPAKHLTHQ